MLKTNDHLVLNASDKQALLEVKDLTHQYPQRGLVLDAVSFALHSGEKMALVGENGAGKTTLFHLLTGLIPRQSGKIYHQQKSVVTESDFVALRQEVGLVFQDPDDQLFCPSVLEDVMFGPLNQGMSVAQAQQKAQQVLVQLNIQHLSERMAAQLSGGEKRMVTLASVLVMQPKVLLLDEPTNALDSNAKEKLLAVLKGLEQAMLVISHDDVFLQQLTNSSLTLQKSKLKLSE
ncbi:MAG: ABC transporter ATP-binding protein [Oceanospirillaceae bacterium]